MVILLFSLLTEVKNLRFWTCLQVSARPPGQIRGKVSPDPAGRLQAPWDGPEHVFKPAHSLHPALSKSIGQVQRVFFLHYAVTFFMHTKPNACFRTHQFQSKSRPDADNTVQDVCPRPLKQRRPFKQSWRAVTSELETLLPLKSWLDIGCSLRNRKVRDAWC